MRPTHRSGFMKGQGAARVTGRPPTFPALYGAEEDTAWDDSEPGLRELFDELGRVARRARARIWKTLSWSLLLALALLLREALTSRAYPASILLRVTEPDVEGTAAPRTNGRLAEYVTNAVFTDARLLEIIDKHGLSPTLVKKNPRLALESLREDIDIEVYRNHFLEDRQEGDPPRSARIALRYAAPDPKLALAVVRDLGDLIIREEVERRREQVELAKRHAKRTVEDARADVEARQREMVEKLVAQVETGRPQVAVAIELRQMQSSLNEALERLEAAQREETALDLSGALEQEALGLRFELVDWGTAAAPDPLPVRLTILGVLGLLTMIPFVGTAVGAFDTRVYDPDDVRRLGLTAVGAVKPADLVAIAPGAREDAHPSNRSSTPRPAPAGGDAAGMETGRGHG